MSYRYTHHQTLASGTTALTPQTSGVPNNVYICDMYISNQSGGVAYFRDVAESAGGIAVADGQTLPLLDMYAGDSTFEIECTGAVYVTYITVPAPAVGDIRE